MFLERREPERSSGRSTRAAVRGIGCAKSKPRACGVGRGPCLELAIASCARFLYVDARHQSLIPPLATGIQVEAV